MKMVLKMAVFTVVAAFLCSCSSNRDGDPVYNYTDEVYMVNESSHQIYMSSVDIGKYHEWDVRFYPESIVLDPADSAVDGSNVWSSARSYLGVVNEFYTPSYMTVTIDGIYSYNICSYAGTAVCKCSSGSCKCGEDTAGESDYCCMCGADVINPCERKNWTLVSINGVENKDNVIHTNEDGETVVVWTYTITEEMVEQTLSLLAEE
ncbi:MAG: hypothetical protein LUD72_04655 [Bacteroidales bacterium]|nr:hypothetical protein [Bacteroidales bacterium]